MKKIILLFVCTVSFLCSSCSDFLEEYSQDMIIAKQVSDLDEVLLGSVYIPSSEISYGMSASGCGSFMNILADDIGTGYAEKIYSINTYNYVITNMFGYYAWQFDVRTNFEGTGKMDDAGTWNNLYYRINIANIILSEIEDLPRNTNQEQQDYIRILGETHFLRAQFYFFLANLYGKPYNPKTCETDLCVPLKLTAYVEHDKNKETQFERATVAEVYNQIVEDLLLARAELTESPQNPQHLLHRASLEAVELLLSRVYLYMQDWKNAAAMADNVTRSDNFMLSAASNLIPSVEWLTSENVEVIFSQGPNYCTPDGCLIGAAGGFCVTRELYDMYDDNDARKGNFFSTNSLTDSIGLAYKYKPGIYTAHISDIFMMRMSEAYLNKAEALAMQNQDGDACNALNTLRKNRINNYTDQTYTGEELVKQIRDERRKELCFEGHRWFDLRRYMVNEIYPYSRTIIHKFNIYSDDGNWGGSKFYRLKENDLAYTFALPASVREFDKTPMIDNEREPRPALVFDEDGNEIVDEEQ